MDQEQEQDNPSSNDHEMETIATETHSPPTYPVYADGNNPQFVAQTEAENLPKTNSDHSYGFAAVNSTFCPAGDPSTVYPSFGTGDTATNYSAGDPSTVYPTFGTGDPATIYPTGDPIAVYPHADASFAYPTTGNAFYPQMQAAPTSGNEPPPPPSYEAAKSY